MTSTPQAGSRFIPRRNSRRNFTAGLETQAAPQLSSPTPANSRPPVGNNGSGKPKNEEEATIQAMLEAEALQRIRLEEQKKRWAAWVNEEYIKCKNARIQFERQWYLNLAFVNGRHYVAPIDVPGQGFRLTAPRAPAHRVRLVVNKVRTAVRTECSKLTGSRPIPTVVPATNEDEDFTAAQVGERLIQAAFANADFERTYRDWIWWGVVCGTSFMKSYWAPNEPDPDLVEPQQPLLGDDGMPILDDNGEPIMEVPKPIKGRIVRERITPFHIFVPDLLTNDINKQPYLIHATTRSPLWVQRNFGFRPVPDTRASSTIMESAFLVNKNSEEVLDSVLVKEVWLKKDAHPDFPEGGLLTVINDRVVQYKQEWPYPFPEYPYYKYDGIPTGSFYSDSIVVDLIPLNKEYNRTRSQAIEIKNTMGKPKLLYPRGSINPRQISSEPGQGIPYTPGFDKPTELRGAEVPSSFHMELERLNVDFDDISGQHEISRGSTPTSVTSGTAIAYLQEQDDVKLNYQVASIEYAMEMLGKHYLKYVATYWTDERLIKVSGTDTHYEAIRWKGSDLRGNTDVRIQTGSALPFSKAAKQAMITEFMQYGWLPPDLGMEILDLGGFSKAMDELLIDKKQAQRENLKMADADPEELQGLLYPPVDTDTGQEMPVEPDGVTPWQPHLPVPVNSWDNHEAHIHYHNQFRKTQQFELLDDEVKHLFELHVQMHQIAMMGMMQGEMGIVGSPEQAMMGQEQAQGEQDLMAQEQEMEQQAGNNNLQQALTMSQINMNESQIAANQRMMEQ